MKKKNKRQTSAAVNGNGEAGKETTDSADGEANFHDFSDNEVNLLQTELLTWYDANKRDLPWRLQSNVSDINKRAYAVWVSEIMLQQTQVATVIDYYKRWMKKWPDLQALANATLEEVNEMWSGLGYYSRGRRLHEGSQKVVTELKGEMPRSAEDLQKQLPGVGRYTAGAVSSIALGQKTGVVDGNVIRVLSRLRMIGAESSSQTTMDAFWNLANGLAQCERPGDLNQGLMELGATVCTPKTPQCSSCPLRQICKAYAKVERQKEGNASRLFSKETGGPIVSDIECLVESCNLCLSPDNIWDSSLGVQNFPRKAKKKPAREQTTFVYIVCRTSKDIPQLFLVLQRPDKGLLAGLWEFPSFDKDSNTDHPRTADVMKQLTTDHGVHISSSHDVEHLGQVVHVFSHIRQTYVVSMVSVAEDCVKVRTERPARWLSKKELDDAALSTAMRKVFRLCGQSQQPVMKGTKRKREEEKQDGKNQISITSFFKPTN